MTNRLGIEWACCWSLDVLLTWFLVINLSYLDYCQYHSFSCITPASTLPGSVAFILNLNLCLYLSTLKQENTFSEIASSNYALYIPFLNLLLTQISFLVWFIQQPGLLPYTMFSSRYTFAKDIISPHILFLY